MDFDQHVRAKDAHLNVDAVPMQCVGKPLDEWFCYFWAGGIHETRSASFASVSIKRELGHNQRLTFYVKQAQIQLARTVFKDAQTRDLARQPIRICRLIVVGDAQQNHQSRADSSGDLAADGYRRLAHTLHDGAHTLP
jgi:hypothetical protein